MNQRQAIFTAILLAILIGLGALSGNYANKLPQASSLGNSSPVVTASHAPVVTKGQTGKTALDVLKASHKVETTDSSFGTFVTSIDGIEGTQNSAWIYYLDGKEAVESPDKAQTTDGQTIEWRYETF